MWPQGAPNKVSIVCSMDFSNLSHYPITISPCTMCVQYIGGCSVHRGVFSTLGDTMVHQGYHEYIGGVQYIGGIS